MASTTYAWLIFALVTVFSWGLYGIFLHSGQVAMGDPAHGRMKSFLFVGLAYFVVAVLVPIVVLKAGGASLDFKTKGMALSFFAGVLGAIGALGVLFAFGAGGLPSVVMSIVFAGAPVVNAVVALSLHPPAGGFSALRWQFILGIFLAALGGCLVTIYKPAPSKPAAVKTNNA